MPQAFKNVLPALANEFIVLLKETSICGYIGLMDLTRGGDIIRSRTYNAFYASFGSSTDLPDSGHDPFSLSQTVRKEAA